MEDFNQHLRRFRKKWWVAGAIATAAAIGGILKFYSDMQPPALAICRAISLCEDRAAQTARYEAFSLGGLVATEAVNDIFATSRPQWKAAIVGRQFMDFEEVGRMTTVEEGAKEWLIRYQGLIADLKVSYPYDKDVYGPFSIVDLEFDDQSAAAASLREKIRLFYNERTARDFDAGWSLRLIAARAGYGYYFAGELPPKEFPGMWMVDEDAWSTLATLAAAYAVPLEKEIKLPAEIKESTGTATNFKIQRAATHLETKIKGRLLP